MSVSPAQYGFLVLYLVALSYLFLGLAILCDNFFVPCLQRIQKRSGISEALAGASLMALGSSAPEIFTSILTTIGGGQNNIELGLGTMVGSGMFDFTVCIGVASLFCKHPVSLRPLPVLLNTTYYLLSIGMLYLFFLDKVVTVLEASIMVASWIVYLLLLYFFASPPPKTVSDALWNYSQPGGSLDEEIEEGPSEDVPFFKPELDAAYPQACTSTFVSVLGKPWDILFRLTVPSKSLKSSSSAGWYAFGFIMMVFYIALCSRLMLLLIDKVIESISLPYAIAGLTLVAWGSDVPDCINAAVSVRRGAGEMAVSSTIGAQIVNILMGLGAPWLVSAIAGRPVHVASSTLINSILVLGIGVLFFALVVIVNKFRLSAFTGYSLLVAYLGYLVFEFTYNAKNYS